MGNFAESGAHHFSVVGITLSTSQINRTTRKGRPNYPIDFKRSVAVLACVPSVSVAKLALKHGINANLIFKWRRHYRAGKFGAQLPEHLSACDASTVQAHGVSC